MLRVPPVTVSQADWDAWSVSERMAQLNAYLCDTLHVQEDPKGSNTGPAVNEFLAIANLHAEPWCMAQQIWCAIKCGAPDRYIPPQWMRASTVNVANWAKYNGRVVKTPRRGDIFIHIDANGKQGHAGCVIEVLGDGTMRTIEGNTNTDGSREGYAVCRHVRPLSYAAVFVRLW